MKRIPFLLISVATLGGVVAFSAHASRHSDQAGAPTFVTKIPAGYRDWKLISIADEEGNLNSCSAIAGNQGINQGLPRRLASVPGLNDHCCVHYHLFRRRKTTKSLAVPDLSLPALPRILS
jgi:hypothetical protein